MFAELPFSEIRAALAKTSSEEERRQRLELLIPSFNAAKLKSLVQSLQGLEFLLFRAKQGKTSLAIGRQVTLTSFESLRDFQKNYTGLIFGHRQFEPLTQKIESPEWQELRAVDYFVPWLELELAASGTVKLTVPLLRPHHEIITALDELEVVIEKNFRHNAPAAASLPSVAATFRDTPAQEDWVASVERVIVQELESTKLQKVALAKKKTAQLNHPLSFAQVLELYWNENESNYFIAYAYAPSKLFVSYTPETLLKVEDRQIILDALAGTAPRHSESDEDKKLEEELLTSQKDLAEHQHVVDEICRGLSLVARDLKLTGPKIKKLKKVQHLLTQCEATLAPEVLVTDLLHLFHPTPAVGGLPRGKALELISQREGFERGLYAAPIGVFSTDRADFAVALRCFHTYDGQLDFYAGVGLVKHSSAEKEWEETEFKLRELLERLESLNISRPPSLEEGGLHA